jgi:uncharacterized protein (UPF0276 family)
VDSHDHPVPEGVFDLLPRAVRACPNLEAIFLERFNETLTDAREVASYREDFRRVRRAVEAVFERYEPAEVVNGDW